MTGCALASQERQVRMVPRDHATTMSVLGKAHRIVIEPTSGSPGRTK